MAELNKPIMWSSTVLAAAAGGDALAQSSFEGLYGGVSYGLNTSDENSLGYSYNSGNAAVFLGYDKQINNFTIGGEIAYTIGGVGLDQFSIDGYEANNVLDLKARIGTNFNRVHLYGVVGYSMADIDSGYGGGSESASGLNFGVGADFAVTERITVGIEYLRRNFEDTGDYATTDSLSTVGLRVGFRF